MGNGSSKFVLKLVVLSVAISGAGDYGIKIYRACIPIRQIKDADSVLYPVGFHRIYPRYRG